MEKNPTYENLQKEIAELRAQLEESHEIINAIRTGEVDAFIVKEDDKLELYTLRSADKTYRLFIEHMSEGVVTLNQDNVVLYCNSSFADFIHTGMENVIGTSFENLLPAHVHGHVHDLIKKAWKQNESRGEIDLPGNPKSKPVLLSMNTMQIDNESALSIIITDLSLQKETQQQKKAMEQKDEFISIASHELKTPVTSVKGYVQILKHNFMKQQNAEAVAMLEKADTQLNKLSNLINELLDVKKIENGQLQYHRDEFDLDELVREIIDETARLFPNHKIVFDPCETCKIMGDRNKIGQVITNLLENAGKYSPIDTTIQISTIRKGGNIQLLVRDKGKGIPLNQQERIFERFFRVNGEKEKTYSGLGLGLYISAEIVKRHQGNIGVESEENNGSTFYFELPVH